MKFDLSDIENSISDQDSRVEQAEQDREQLNLKTDALEAAAGRVGEDKEILSVIESNVSKAEQDKEHNVQQIQEISSEIQQLQSGLEETMEEIGREKSVLETLKSIGEDVSAAESILAEREQAVLSSNEKLKELADRLGLCLSDLEAKIVEPVTDAMQRLEEKRVEESDAAFTDAAGSDAATHEEAIGSMSMDGDDFSPVINQILDDNLSHYISSDPGLTAEQREKLLHSASAKDTVQTASEGAAAATVPDSPFKDGAGDRMPPIPPETESERLSRLAGIDLQMRRNKAMRNDPEANEIADTLLRQEKNGPSADDEYTFVSANGDGFTDSYRGVITSQGTAYPNQVVNDCGVCTMVNLANQLGASYTEKSGLAYGAGQYSYKKHAPEKSGWTSLDEQKGILNALGYEGTACPSGMDFDSLVQEIESGNSVSVNVYGEDLSSGSRIAHRNRILEVMGMGPGANHAVTVAGAVKNRAGDTIGIFILDTGGYGGNDNPIIYVSRDKYQHMKKRTPGFSSVICTGRRRYVADL